LFPAAIHLSPSFLFISEAVKRLKQAAFCASRANLLTVKMNSRKQISHSDEWNRALTIDVKKTDALMDAHDSARVICDANQSAFHPHLSFLYGCYDEPQRDSLVNSVSKEIECGSTASFVASEISLAVVPGTSHHCWTEVVVPGTCFFYMSQTTKTSESSAFYLLDESPSKQRATGIIFTLSRPSLPSQSKTGHESVGRAG
jgi:hypothetical protein